uniref:PAS domain-containing protein n=1 Tax=Chrysotila carterae TaxID=13221 RepID=A0A7S4BUU6_CHRCT
MAVIAPQVPDGFPSSLATCSGSGLTCEKPSSHTFLDENCSDQQPQFCKPDESATMECYTEAAPPFRILWATPTWLGFCGFQPHEVRGQTFQIIQGEHTQTKRGKGLSFAAQWGLTARTTMTNYTKDGLPFEHHFQIEPLRNSNGDICLYKVRWSTAPNASSHLCMHDGVPVTWGTLCCPLARLGLTAYRASLRAAGPYFECGSSRSRRLPC